MATILLIDDEAAVVTVLGKLLRSRGHEVLDTTDIDQAAAWAAEPRVQVVLTDVRMGEVNGIDLMIRFRQARPDLPVLLMSGEPSVEIAVQAARAGAFDFLVKPLKLDFLDRAIREAVGQGGDGGGGLAPVVPAEFPRRHGLVGSAPAFLHAVDQAERLALADVPVLIRSEAGAGAGAMADLVHRLSRVSDRPFAVAHGEDRGESELEDLLFAPRTGWLSGSPPGTLYLAGLQEFAPGLQERIRQVLAPESASDAAGPRVRLIASIRITGDGDVERIANSQLLNMLGAFAFDVPPLRSRVQDIVPLFVENLVRKEDAPAPVTVETEARAMLERYFWPGNLTELREVAEAVQLPGDRVVGAATLRDLLPEPEPGGSEFAPVPTARSASVHGQSLERFLRQKELQDLDRFLRIPYDTSADFDRRIREILARLRDRMAVSP